LPETRTGPAEEVITSPETGAFETQGPEVEALPTDTHSSPLETIYFEFDRYDLLSEARRVLKLNATWLRSHPDVRVRLEGHCDERGTEEYNLALGDRRADAARRYLVDLGIRPDRLLTISYGESRPADPRSTERAWAKNRRVEFVILTD
jgi:peptidoglycan-associated lipoprotein